MFHNIEDAIEDIRQGKMIIVVDDENRENEGDFVMASDMVTPEAINFMAVHGRGLICTPITESKAQQLGLEKMVRNNGAPYETAFTVSIDAAHGIDTGISANDRSHSIRLMMGQGTRPEDFVRPGHIFPLIAKNGGVLERDGHTEAAVDFSRLAGLNPSGVICEICNEDGSMARVDDLIKLSKRHNLKLVTIKDLIQYRLENEQLYILEQSIRFGGFDYYCFQNRLFENQKIHLISSEQSSIDLDTKFKVVEFEPTKDFFNLLSRIYMAGQYEIEQQPSLQFFMENIENSEWESSLLSVLKEFKSLRGEYESSRGTTKH